MKIPCLNNIRSCNAKIVTSLFFIFFGISAGFSQNIKGIVISEKEHEFIPYATVRLYKDSILIAAVITEENGKFKFENINKGRYLLRINYIGFKPYNAKIAVSDKAVNLKTISLSQNNIELNEIIVKGDRGTIKTYVDKNVVVPDTNILKGSINALDVLSKIPNLKVNRVNNSVTILGEQNVLILINGSDRQGNENLKTIKPDDIDRIEIITNPSAKYDSEYTGVLNIILKKKNIKGLTINIDIEYYSLPHNESEIDLKYGIGKFRFFGSYSVYYRNHSKLIKYNRETNTLDKLSSYNSTDSVYKNFELGHFFQYGFDYFINKNNILNFSANFFPINTDYSAKTKTLNYLNHIFNNSFTDLSTSKGSYNMQNYSVYYRKHFSEKNQELNIDFNFYKMIYTKNSNYSDTFFNAENVFLYKTERITNAANNKKSYNLKIDFSQPLNKIFSVETGYNLYIRNFNNSYNEAGFNDIFHFSEYRNALYFSSFAGFKKINLQAGIRVENSHIFLNDSITDNYSYFSPSSGIMYKINKANSFRFNYRRRLSRPRFNILNPFVYRIDSMNYTKGNSYIKPSEQDNFNLTYNFYKNKFFISPSLFYTIDRNVIGSVINVNNNIRYKKYENIGNGKTFGFKISSSVTLFKILVISPYFEVSRQLFEYQNILNSGYTISYNISTQLNLPKDILIGADISQPGKQYYLQGYAQENVTFDDLYIGKSFLKNKGNIMFGISDLFQNTGSINFETMNNYEMTVNSKTKFRMFIIKFYYTFHKGSEIKELKREYNMEKDK